MNQLALWALFKGPVSANMTAAVLELEEEQMKDLVDTYSSWFNSPESGKYQLYHERLRVYLLQKLKAEEVQVINEKLISFLEDAIKQAKGEEDEYYALEHLHQHMALESQLGNHYERLHSYVNQEKLVEQANTAFQGLCMESKCSTTRNQRRGEKKPRNEYHSLHGKQRKADDSRAKQLKTY